jgi:hypothetical protein
MRLRTVAKDGALQALSESRPGVQAAKRDLELEAARAEAAGWARQSRSWPSSWCWWREKGVGTEWPGPAAGGRGHQGWAAGLAPAGLAAGLEGAGRLPGVGGRRAAHLPVAGQARRWRAGRPGPGWHPDAWPAGLGGRRDRGAGRGVGRDRPLPPQARPPRLLPGAGVGVAGQRAPRAGARGPAVAAAAPTGPQPSQAVPGLGRVPARVDLDLRHDPLHPRRGRRHRGRGPGVAQVAGRDRLRRGDLHPGPGRVHRRAGARGPAGADQRPPRRPGRPPPWTIRPGRCCWPSATTARR